MPSMNQKNLGISPAVNALGLGDQLIEQVNAQVDERKKKMRDVASMQKQGVYSPAMNMLMGGSSLTGD